MKSLIFTLAWVALQFGRPVLADVGASCIPVETAGAQSVTEGLTPFWWQEYVEADLARDFMRKMQSKTVKVVDADGGFEREFIQGKVSSSIAWDRLNVDIHGDHATLVCNLLNGP